MCPLYACPPLFVRSEWNDPPPTFISSGVKSARVAAMYYRSHSRVRARACAHCDSRGGFGAAGCGGVLGVVGAVVCGGVWWHSSRSAATSLCRTHATSPPTRARSSRTWTRHCGGDTRQTLAHPPGPQPTAAAASSTSSSCLRARRRSSSRRPRPAQARARARAIWSHPPPPSPRRSERFLLRHSEKTGGSGRGSFLRLEAAQRGNARGGEKGTFGFVFPASPVVRRGAMVFFLTAVSPCGARAGNGLLGSAATARHRVHSNSLRSVRAVVQQVAHALAHEEVVTIGKMTTRSWILNVTSYLGRFYM